MRPTSSSSGCSIASWSWGWSVSSAAHRSLEFEPFLHDRVVLVVPSGHAFAGRTVTLRELRAEPLIVMQPGAAMRRLMDDELRRVGVRPATSTWPWRWGCRSRPSQRSKPGSGWRFCRPPRSPRSSLATLAVAEVEQVDLSRDFYAVRHAGRRVSRVASSSVSGAARNSPRSDADAGRPHGRPARLDYSDGWCASVTRAALSSA